MAGSADVVAASTSTSAARRRLASGRRRNPIPCWQPHATSPTVGSSVPSVVMSGSESSVDLSISVRDAVGSRDYEEENRVAFEEGADLKPRASNRPRGGRWSAPDSGW
jgi:hypothetical protein